MEKMYELQVQRYYAAQGKPYMVMTPDSDDQATRN